MYGLATLSAAANTHCDHPISRRGKLTILRFFQPLLFALALLFAQQGAALHALSHSFAEQTQQKNKQTPHSPACEQCTSYAQLGSALDSGYISLELHAPRLQTPAQQLYTFYTRHSLPGIARGPPFNQISA
jgi:hypothetical protein